MSVLIKNDLKQYPKSYLNVPWDLKDQAYTLGARWDKEYKLYCVTSNCTRITEISKLTTRKYAMDLKATIPKYIIKHEFVGTDEDDLVLNDKMKMLLSYKADEIQTLISEIVKPEIIYRIPDYPKIYGFNKN